MHSHIICIHACSRKHFEELEAIKKQEAEAHKSQYSNARNNNKHTTFTHRKDTTNGKSEISTKAGPSNNGDSSSISSSAVLGGSGTQRRIGLHVQILKNKRKEKRIQKRAMKVKRYVRASYMCVDVKSKCTPQLLFILL